jgi:hypothetical protein
MKNKNKKKKKKKNRKQPPLSKRNATTPRLYISEGKEKLIKIKNYNKAGQ